MPAKRTKLANGAKVRIKSGVTIPEVPPVNADSWTGLIVEVKGRAENLQYIIEWDDETEAKMPQEFIRECEEAGLFYKMACLPHTAVEEV
ncbi:MAG: hypothetical protein R3C12_24870 [Planctomycetaceae bacterium]|nr:hypothetical protein [Planctomycetaceae bacterium]